LNTRTIVVILAAIIATGVSSAWYLQLSAAPKTIREDFENGFGEWGTDADVPLDPNNPGHPVEWDITHSTDVANSGQYSIKLSIDGLQDEGTIWIERKIAVQKNSQMQVNVSFDFYSEQESFNTIAAVCAFAGVRNPEAEEDFVVVGSANEIAGWKKYSLTRAIDTGSSEELWVALGISVRWETYMTYYIDNVEIKVL